MKPFTESITDITAELKRHINLRVNLITLVLSRKLTVVTSFVITIFIVASLLGFILLMLSLAFVFWYGSHVGAYHHGFLIVSSFYAAFGTIVLLNRKKLLINPLVRLMTQQLEITGSEIEPIPDLKNLNDINHHVEIIKLKIQQSELILQQKFESVGDSLQPMNILKNLFDNLFSTSDLVLTAMNLAIKWLRKYNQSDESDKEEASDR